MRKDTKMAQTMACRVMLETEAIIDVCYRVVASAVILINITISAMREKIAEYDYIIAGAGQSDECWRLGLVTI